MLDLILEHLKTLKIPGASIPGPPPGRCPGPRQGLAHSGPQPPSSVAHCVHR